MVALLRGELLPEVGLGSLPEVFNANGVIWEECDGGCLPIIVTEEANDVVVLHYEIASSLLLVCQEPYEYHPLLCGST